MSKKLVKRQLQLSNDDIFIGEKLTMISSGEASQKRKRDEQQQEKRRKRKKQQQVDASTSTPLNVDEIVAWHVASMTGLDQAIQSKSSNGDKVLSRLEKEQEQQRKRSKTSSRLILGNSRGTSSQLRQLVPPAPTFNKTKHQEELKNNRLREIAKLLKKNAKKENKASSPKK
jgi:hypothetical protein